LLKLVRTYVAVDVVEGLIEVGGHVEQLVAERVRVSPAQVGDAVGPADGADHDLAAVQQLGGQLPAEGSW
jgi:hypothetical protein